MRLDLPVLYVAMFAVDTWGMIEFEYQQMHESPEYGLLLNAYLERFTCCREQDAEFDGWCIRIAACDGVPPELLARAHGRLISFGLLEFQLTSRTVGLRYQVTRRGRSMLQRLGLIEGGGSLESLEDFDSASEHEGVQQPA